MLSPRKPSARPVVEALEPKLLYSADLGLSAFVPAASEAVAHKAQLAQDLGATTASAQQATQQARAEIVFLDANVPDAGALTHDIQQQAAQGRAIEVVVIQGDEDGLSRITQTLKDRHDVAAIHLIGHGESGDMQLGQARLDAHTLLSRAGDIALWGSAMSTQADILLYGCDVAQGTSGHALVQGLAALTGADVAASEDLTGATSLGGNWILEDQTGQIDSALAVSAAMQSQYTGVLLQATPSTKGTGIWTESGFTTPQQGTWDGLTQGSQSNTAVSTTWTTVTSAESPTRNEAIVVGVDTNGVVRGERWDGTQWNALPTNPLSTVSSGVRQSFAVAYEQKTGNAMLVWDDGTALSYSVYNGTSWSTAATVSAYTGAEPQQMHIAANPKGNDMALVISDINGDDYALIWNGSSWGHAVTLDTSGTGINDQLSTAVAYESQSGVAMVAYAKANNANVYYRLFNGSTWGNETAAGSYSGTAYPLYLTLASDPNSNRLAMGLHSVSAANAHVQSFSIWNGSSWGSRVTPGSYTNGSSPGSNVAVAFESLSGDVLAMYGTTGNNASYLTWSSSSGTWSSSATGPAAAYMKLFSDPYSDHIMVGAQTTSNALTFVDWTGSAFGTSTSVATNTGVGSPAFTWLWKTDLSGNKTNALLVGGSAASSGWTGVNTVSAGEVLEFADPNLQYGSTTSGTFSHFVDLSTLGASGVDDVAMVSQDVTLTAGLTVHRGDLLFMTSATSTLTNADGSTTSANKSDLVMYRPSVSGRYDKGTFAVLAQNIASGLLGLGTADVRGLALVEQDTVVGDVTLTAGSILFTAGTTTAAADIQVYVPNGGGLLGGLLTGNASVLLRGSDANIGIGQAITGLELVSANTTLKNMTLTAGTLLISLEASDTIGTNNLSVTPADVVILSPTLTSVNGNASATATRLMRGSSVGASGVVFDSLALSLDAAPVITSNGGGATAPITINENTTAVTTVTATDVDSNPSGLTYSISGGADASLFQINATTGVLRFNSAPNFEAPTDANSDNQYEVTVSASDGTTADTQAISVSVQNVNEAPDITSDGGGIFSILIVPDNGTAATTVQATDPDAGDTITYAVSGTDAGLFDIDPNSGVLTFKTVPSAAAPSDANGDNIYNLTLTATDTSALSTTQYAFIRVVAASGGANATPVINSNGGGATAAQSINEEATAVTTVQATDTDSATLTYSITGGADQALFNIAPLSGALTFKTAPIAASPTDADHNNIYEVTVSASDGNTADTQGLSITVLAYNKPPVNTLPATYDVSQSTTLPLTGLSVSDADAGGSTVTVDLSVQHGVLFVLNNVSGGLTFSNIAYSIGNSHVQLTGTIAAINTTLAANGGLLYYPTWGYVGIDTLTMVTDDGGNTGIARSTPQTSDTDTSAINVSASDIAPTLATSTGSASFNEHTTAVAIDPGLSLTDPDTTTFTGATVQITGAWVSAEDVLGFVAQNNIAGNWNSGTGVLTLSGSDTLANYQAALRSITYNNTSQNPDTTTRTITFSISDSSSTAAATRDVTITPYNNPPTFTPGSTALSYTENGVSTPVDPGLTLTDADNATYSGATVTITNVASGQDILRISNTANISGSWDGTLGVLTLTGTDTTANYQAALRSVSYYNTSDNPSTLARTVVFSVDDGNGPTTVSQTINITAVNDPPSLYIPSTALAYAENEAPKQVAPSLALSDVDNANFSGATIQITTGYVNGEDVLSFTNTANITASWDSNLGKLTLSGTDTVAAYQTALHDIRYSNTSDNPTTATRTVTFGISDGQLSRSATRDITVTSVNDSPAFAINSLSIHQGASATPQIQIVDPDNNVSTASITATGITGGYFMDDRNNTVVTQFLYADVQGGHIQFVHDGSASQPTYVLTASDGADSSAGNVVAVQFTALPPSPSTPPAPPEPPTTNTTGPTEAPAAAPAPAPTAGTSTSQGTMQQAPAPSQGTIYVPEPSRANLFEQDLRLPVAATKPAVDVQPRPNPPSTEAAAQAQTATDAFQFSWTTNLQATAATEDLRRNLEALRDQLQDQGTEHRHVVASSIALTTGLSVGYVIWLVRGGALIGSMLSAMPAWQMIDPLPVLTRGRARSLGESSGDDDQSVEQLFDGDHSDAKAWPPEPPPTPNAADMRVATHGTEPEVRS